MRYYVNTFNMADNNDTFTAREKSLKRLYELLKDHTLDELRLSHDLFVCYHPTEKLAILHYGRIEKVKYASEVDSCRGLIIESFPPYKVVSHGFDRFLPKYENLNNQIKLKQATVKEDGSLMFLFKYNDKFHLATMYDFATNTLAFSDKTYAELFLEIINQPLDQFAQNIVNQFPNPDEIMTISFELCSLYNRVIKEYKIPTLYLTSVYGGTNGLTGSNVPKTISLCPNVELVTEISFDKEFISFQDAHDKVLEYIKTTSKGDNYTFEGFVLLTEDDKRIKIKNPYYYILHNLKYKGFTKCTPDIMVPLIANGIDDIIIQIVVDSMPYDKIFVEKELKKRRDHYKNIMDNEKQKIEKAIENLKNNNVSTPKELISVMNNYDKDLFNTWNHLFFTLFKNGYIIADFYKCCISNIPKLFNDNSHKMLSVTHPPFACKYYPTYDFKGRDLEPGSGIGKDPYTCFCGSPMKLTELRTDVHRYRYCHCGEAYDFLTYGSWTYLLMCTNIECTCTHETNSKTRLPLGIPASSFCKSLRLQVHELMNRSKLSKSECYKKIQNITNKTEDEAHMAKFCIQDCLKVLNQF
jgi:hypothetical protein